ncbi:endonuclease [Candidatus Gottesmanbacteria bacterium CG11_big_fil_rev_8_21_14_0_20_37_11]|uniref:Endonuclease n=2 Tax=Candidatus Gottesmaniibacteriota TaxID=1752720 RepID=A0A2M7RPM3_9BACT|nr:MAG: endonuclease [Candidatus Gottesmanbacteria bacterium CG11_big_fil_rev_8_21_14_0_20_37_11]PIZ02130.1 MAG: endonuclease [Candidatus Gottesmanbacteria bacterium CG_4_10_14_0_8_um_filter_37_24]
MIWFLYLAICNDKSIYTGITTNLKRRENEHNSDNKLGAKSLRNKRPIKIVYNEEYNTLSQARKREIEIKKWDRENKIKLILQ